MPSFCSFWGMELNQQQDNVFFRCVEDCTEAIMISDRGGQLTYVNPAWVQIYGYSQEEAIGQTPRLLRSRHQTESFYEDMWKQILDPKVGSWRGELINLAKDGREVPVELSITPIKNGSENVGYMAIALDISDKKRLMAQILQQDRLASIGLLASGLAHEIGTPMGVIRGRAEFLKKRLDEELHWHDGLDVIIAQIDRVSSLVNNLLSLGRGSKNQTGVAVLDHVVSDTVDFLGQKFKELGVEIHLKVDLQQKVRMSHNELQQVLINLLVNASDSIASAIESGRKEGHELNLETTDLGEYIEIVIADTGTGISEEHQKNLFRPFFTTKPIGEGTGLGLSLSAQLVTAAGGELALRSSELDRGTSFSVRLPKF